MDYLSVQERKILGKFKRKVLEKFGDQAVSFTLFGSRARGEGHEESDLDVLILTKERNHEVRRDIIAIASDLFLNYEINISPLIMDRVHFQSLKKRELLLPQEIEKDGIPL